MWVNIALILLHGTLCAVAVGAINGNRLWAIRNETRRLLMGDAHTEQWRRKIRNMRYIWLGVLGLNAGVTLSQLYALVFIGLY